MKTGKLNLEDFVLVDRNVSIKGNYGDTQLVYIGDILIRPERIVSITGSSNCAGFKGYYCVRMDDGDSFYISEDSYKNLWEGIEW